MSHQQDLERNLNIMDNKKKNYGIIFGDNNLYTPITFGYIDIDVNNYNYNAEVANTKRQLYPDNGLVRGIEFLNPRVGDNFINYNGSEVILTEYKNKNEIYSTIITEHSDGTTKRFLKKGLFKAFKDKEIKSPYDISICKTAYLGIGNYLRRDNELYYMYFISMHNRVKHSYKTKFIQYKDASIDPIWNDFQKFCEWCSNNYYSFPNEVMQVDKDLLIRKNKIYSPDTCVFLPNRINSLLSKSNIKRGKYPVGVEYYNTKKGLTFRSDISFNGERIWLGTFDTPEEAFYAYKEKKEELIKDVADDYYYNKGGQYIPQFKKVYEAMHSYTLEIDD